MGLEVPASSKETLVEGTFACSVFTAGLLCSFRAAAYLLLIASLLPEYLRASLFGCLEELPFKSSLFASDVFISKPLLSLPFPPDSKSVLVPLKFLAKGRTCSPIFLPSSSQPRSFCNISNPDGSKPSRSSASGWNLNIFQFPKKLMTRSKKLLATSSVYITIIRG
nr:hypothetical protein Iba_chr05cCG1870 [Ipomoea batatas]